MEDGGFNDGGSTPKRVPPSLVLDDNLLWHDVYPCGTWHLGQVRLRRWSPAANHASSFRPSTQGTQLCQVQLGGQPVCWSYLLLEWSRNFTRRSVGELFGVILIHIVLEP